MSDRIHKAPVAAPIAETVSIPAPKMGFLINAFIFVARLLRA
jgi:hypothetical protein